MVSTHLKKYSSNWTSCPNRGENKRYLKPPPRNCLFFISVVLWTVWAVLPQAVLRTHPRWLTICWQSEFPWKIRNQGSLYGHYTTNSNNALLKGKSFKFIIHYQCFSPNVYNLMIPGNSLTKLPFLSWDRHYWPSLCSFTPKSCLQKKTAGAQQKQRYVSKLVEGSLNRNFRQYGELKTRCIAQQ